MSQPKANKDNIRKKKEEIDLLKKNDDDEYVVCRGGTKVCNEEVVVDGLLCDCCNTWYHYQCQGLTKVRYDSISEMADDITWYCLSCKVVVKKLVDNVGKLTKKCFELEKNVTDLHAEVQTVKKEHKESYKVLDEKMICIGMQLWCDASSRKNSPKNHEDDIYIEFAYSTIQFL